MGTQWGFSGGAVFCNGMYWLTNNEMKSCFLGVYLAAM